MYIGLEVFKVGLVGKGKPSPSPESTLIEKKRRHFSRPVLVGLIITLVGLLGILILGSALKKPVMAPQTAQVASNNEPGPAVAQAAPAPDLQKSWQVQRLIADAKKFASAGDALQARMSLEQALVILPENAEARQLLGNLENGRGAQIKQEISSELLERGEMLVKQAEEAANSGNYRFARESFTRASALFNDVNTKPAYYARIEEGIKTSEARLSESLAPRLQQASELVNSGSAPRLKEAVGVAKGVLSEWPGYARAEEVLQKAYDRLDKLALQFVMKADTLRQLSGCKDAVPQYRSALEVASYPEVPAYQKAEIGIGQCQ